MYLCAFVQHFLCPLSGVGGVRSLEEVREKDHHDMLEGLKSYKSEPRRSTVEIHEDSSSTCGQGELHCLAKIVLFSLLKTQFHAHRPKFFLPSVSITTTTTHSGLRLFTLKLR